VYRPGMIASLRPGTGTGAAGPYAGTMAGFWSGLSSTLRGLEAFAADGDRLDEEALGPLRTLQYRLHRSGEVLAGVRPPEGASAVHAELRDSLVAARDATAELIEAIEVGGREAAAQLLFEWRGALFRVRLARHRVSTRPVAEPRRLPPPRTAATATGLVAAGAVAFVAGAALLMWPLWAVGLALLGGSLLLVRR